MGYKIFYPSAEPFITATTAAVVEGEEMSVIDKNHLNFNHDLISLDKHRMTARSTLNSEYN